MQQTPQELPVEAHLDELRQALASQRFTILEAPPGTGKTTRVPEALLASEPGQIWVLEPRRLAARWAAHRVAQQRGQAPGETVGYQVRLDSRCGPHTRLVYMTQGVFARRLLDNPGLDGVSLVILDEFHERSLDNDFALAWLRSRAPAVRVLIMSATLPAELASRLGPCALVRCSSPLFPVALQHDLSDQPLEQRLRRLLPDSSGSGLIFLPGMREIRRCQDELEALARRHGATLQVLHGSLPGDQQDQVLRAPAEQLRWVLTTNVAETSLTVPGVRWVIDSGWARQPVQPPGAALSRLETVRISRFSAQQRTGRAGRLGPGQCLRLYSQQDFASRPDAETPEILRSDLSGLRLFWLQLGAPPLDWLDPPPEAAWSGAASLLEQLGAMRGERLSELGQAMARLPLEPRLARFLLGCPDPRGARAAAWLSRGGDARASDLESYLSRSGPALPEERQLQALISTGDLRGATHLPQDPPRNVDLGGAARLPQDPPRGDWAAADLDQALLAAFPDRVAQLRRGQDLVLWDGSGYRLSSAALADAGPNPWLLALQLELDGSRQARLSAHYRIEPELLLDRPELVEERLQEWNAAAHRVDESTQLRYGQLVLEQSRRRARPGPECAALLRRPGLASAWWRDTQERVEGWRARHHWAATVSPDLQPLPELEEWFEQACLQCSSLAELSELRWELSISPRLRGQLDSLCPVRLGLGSRRVEVHYDAHQKPWIAAKLVDFFGHSQGPQLAGGRIPLVLQLLAPNFRPVQITEDLAGFWQRHYPKVRAELCRRYPRHPWPEDPLHPQREELRPKKRQ